MTGLTDYQAKYFAYELERSYANDHVGKLAGLLFDAQVEPKPHQIDAALFALQSHYLPGVILADEVGLGKTIEAGIIISQYWAERKRSILIVVPSSLRQQWQQELYEKFLLPSVILGPGNKSELLGQNRSGAAEILICSYDFARINELALLRSWDLVIVDEAHRLRNFWTGKAKIADAVAHIAGGAAKTILLTATPLQNRLEELFGLVSVFYPQYFYSIDAFRERYIKGRTTSDGDDLAQRVAEIAKRTLRRDADKYIQFTKRLPLTVEFQPSPDEMRLYNLVNAYLQRDHRYAFSASQQHLTALIIRKRLGSSTYAVASTLEHIADRLSAELQTGQRRDGRGALVLDDDLNSDELEALNDSEDQNGDISLSSLDTAEAIKAEIKELRDYAALARDITVNQKAVKLNEALEQGFARLREIGAPEKAIVFTDSTKTQKYIAETLTASGYGDGLVLFNGSNDSPEATRIYKDWLNENKDGDLITGIAAVDRRKALVEYFRTQGTVMVATEAAAEGINLQFCSMVVNYDLPWNPQRVEQRIGRCHRYGQKHNVVVVNFANKGNIAEQRILELLANKFQLFESVFGASDEVLGAIEDGLDFEKTISHILNRCKTAEEIDQAFRELEATYAKEISEEMESAKAKVFDNLDPHVQDRLKAYDTQSGEVLNKFERLLLAVTEHKLQKFATFEDEGRIFTLHQSPVKEAPIGQYFFKSRPISNAHQYRFQGALAQHVVLAAKAADTPASELTFSVSKSKRASTAVRQLAGQSGTLTANLVTFSMRANNNDVSESYMLSGALTDEGQWLDHEYVADILDLTCEHMSHVPVTNDTKAFEPYLSARRNTLEKEVQGRNAKYYAQQEDLIYSNSLDRKAVSEGKIREFQAKEKEHRKLAKSSDDPIEQLRHKKEARRWADRADDEYERSRAERKELRKESDLYLGLIEQSLQGTQDLEHLFTIRWRVEE